MTTMFRGRNICFIDIETDIPNDKAFKDMGCLAVNRVEVITISWKDEIQTFYGPNCHKYFNDFYKAHMQGYDPVFVGHNVFRFDFPVLRKLHSLDIIGVNDAWDTLLMSKIVCYDRKSHSLESWATSLGLIKPDLSDLIARCEADVRITARLFWHLVAEAERLEIPDNPFKVEFRVAEIIARQFSRGINFDVASADYLRRLIRVQMEDIRRKIDAEINDAPILESKIRKPPKIQFKKDGTPSAAIYKYCNEQGFEVEKYAGEWCATKMIGTHGKSICTLPLTSPLVTFGKLDIDSPDAVKNYLLSKGWAPTMWNRKRNLETGKWENTSPKLFDDNKELCPNIKILGIPELGEISTYLSLRNRLGVLEGWLDNERVKIAGLICSDADTIGAATHRFTHRIVANVPRVTSLYGKEMRALFKPRYGFKQVGWDASSLEARMEAHYTYPYDGGKYAAELMHGDIHTTNQRILGLESRDKAKTWKYAVLYGAQPPKLRATFGWDLDTAQQLFDEFWAKNPALSQLVKDVQARGKKGYIKGLDGRPIPVDSPHSALNRLLQSAGAIVMKYAMVIADRDINKFVQEHGELPDTAYGLIRYHDEEQWEVSGSEDFIRQVAEIGVQSIRKAGKYLKLNVELDGEYKIGNNWAECH